MNFDETWMTGLIPRRIFHCDSHGGETDALKRICTLMLIYALFKERPTWTGPGGALLSLSRDSSDDARSAVGSVSAPEEGRID